MNEKTEEKIEIVNDILTPNDLLIKDNKISELKLSIDEIYSIYFKGNTPKHRNEVLNLILSLEKDERNTLTKLLNTVYENENFTNQHTFKTFLKLLDLEELLTVHNQKVMSNVKILEDEKEYYSSIFLYKFYNPDGTIDIAKVLDDKQVVMQHSYNQSILLPCFNINENQHIKEYYKQRVYETLVSGEEKDLLNIILNTIHVVEPLNLSTKVKIQSQIDNISTIVKEEKTLNKINYDLALSFITNDQDLLLNVIQDINDNSYSLSEIFSTNIPLLNRLFYNYNHDFFALLLEKTDLTVDFTITLMTHWSKKELEFSLAQYAFYLQEYIAAENLIKLGFTITDEEIEYYHSYYTETDFIHFIKMGIITSNFKIENSQSSKNDDEDDENEIFYREYNQLPEHNIFQILLKKFYYDAFFFLYNQTKKNDLSFSLKQYDNPSLVDDYLISSIVKNSCHYEILDIFKNEKMILKDTIFKNNLINKLTSMDIENIVKFIYYLQEFFPEIDKKSLVTYQEKKRPDFQSWLDVTKVKDLLSKNSKCSENNVLLQSIIDRKTYQKPELDIRNEVIFDELREDFPNFLEVINFYQAQFRLNKITGKKRIAPILLIGDPGIGKTHFAQTFAKKLNTGYNFLDMASCSASWIISGADGGWKSAKQGKILEAMINSQTLSPVMLIDEIEKTPLGKNYDPTTVFYQLLEEINAKDFTDEFLNLSFDASGIIYMACANTFGNLSEPLISRFKVFHIEKPTSEQFEKIIYNIYKSSTSNSKIFNPVLSTDVIDTLKEDNIRVAKNMIEDAIGNLLLEVDNVSNIKDNALTIEKKHIIQANSKKSFGF